MGRSRGCAMRSKTQCEKTATPTIKAADLVLANPSQRQSDCKAIAATLLQRIAVIRLCEYGWKYESSMLAAVKPLITRSFSIPSKTKEIGSASSRERA